MKIFFLVLAAFLALATQISTSFSQEADLLLNALILLGAGMCAYAAGSIQE